MFASVVLLEQYFHLGGFVDLDRAFLPVSAAMRLLVEILIVAALILPWLE
jgi:hypothetical protein